MKKAFICLVCICIIMTASTFSAFGEASPDSDSAVQADITAAEVPFELSAKAAILIDAQTGTVIFELNEHEKLFPASVTKIMPLLLFTEALDSGKVTADTTVVCSADAAAKGGSQIWLEEGESMTFDELLRATAIGSANDACTALGEHLAGSETAFVAMMNERAALLGMNDTNFDNCTGLDDDTDTHLTSAYDIALMSRELLKHELICEYTTKWMDTLRNGETELVNTNKLVRFYNGTTGLKTGTTSKAGYCISASAKRGDTHLIAVVLGSDNSTDRFEDAKTMLNYGFAGYETVTPQIDSSLITPVRVIRGTSDVINPRLDTAQKITLPKGAAASAIQEAEIVTDVEAPIEAGQKLGTITLKLNGEKIGEYNITAPEAIDKLSFSYVLRLLLSSLSAA